MRGALSRVRGRCLGGEGVDSGVRGRRRSCGDVSVGGWVWELIALHYTHITHYTTHTHTHTHTHIYIYIYIYIYIGISVMNAFPSTIS